MLLQFQLKPSILKIVWEQLIAGYNMPDVAMCVPVELFNG